MHLPYLQIANEVMDLHAPELAVTLRWNEGDAFLGIARMMRWALGRCPDDAPPSANDTLIGPDAARITARAAGWTKDPDLFVAAVERLPDPPLESIEGGVRFRGLKRYDRAWGKNHKAEWAVWKAWLDARERGETLPRPDGKATRPGTDPALKRAESAPTPAPDRPDSGTKSGRKRAENGPPDADADADADAEELKEEEGVWARICAGRAEAGRLAAEECPPRFRSWLRDAREVTDDDGIVTAHARFLLDKAFGPGWPIAVFMRSSVWRQRAPTRGAPPEALPEDSAPDTPAGSAWASMLRELRQSGRTYALEWLARLTPHDSESGVLVLTAPDRFLADWVLAMYGDMLDELASPLTVRIEVADG